MKKQRVLAGIIGSGFAAKFHYEALLRVHSVDVEIVGVYSRDSVKLNNFTQPRNLKGFTNPDDLIEQCDILHICTPPSTHESLVIKVLSADKHVIVEKPFTGYFGEGMKDFNGDTFRRETGLKQALESTQSMLQAEKSGKGKILYAENWIYAPAIQKEKEVIEKTGAQLLWIQAQQSHSGSHSLDYGNWSKSGGGSLIGKGSHPLAATIYLKQVEGISRTGKSIRPMTVSARTHAITRLPNYINLGHLRDKYKDVEDYASVHIVFEDGTIADITASELLQGGVKNYVEVHANNHRTICNIAPNNAMQSFNPNETYFDNVYVVEKTDTKQGWSFISPDEGWFNGYQHEMDAFYRSVAFDEPVESNSQLAADVTAVIYAAYVSSEKGGVEIAISQH